MNSIEDKIAPHQETSLMHKIESDINEDNDNCSPPLVGHQEQGYDDEDDISDSDDKSDDEDEDDDFYDGPDPGVSNKMLDARRKMILDQQRVRFINQDHELLKEEDALTVEDIQQQREESVLNDVSITSDNYEEEDDDVHGINDIMNISTQEEHDDSFLDDGAIEIEDSD